MHNLLDFLIKDVVGLEDYKIKESEENSIITYELIVPGDSMGFVIGKKGRTIKMLRNLMKVKAILDKVKFNLVISSN